MAKVIDEWGRERRNTRYGILEKLGGRGLGSHYGEAFEATGFAFRIVIRSGGNTTTHTFSHYMGHGNNIMGPMSEEAWLSFVTATFSLRVVHCLERILQHRSHYGNRAFMTIITKQDRLLRRNEGGTNIKGDSNR